MIKPIKIFENFFDDNVITSTRLTNFTGDCINRLTAQNSNGNYINLINLLTAPYENLQAELDSVDTSLGVQKGKTLTLNQFVAMFKRTMSEQEGVIANAIGGFGSAAYLEFYPKGVTEYSAAIKANLSLLISRVNTVATTYATQLGPTLTALLQAFDEQWQLIRNQQEQQKGSVEDNRSGRSEARAELEVALITVVHTIGSMFPDNTEQCMSFFSFNLLLRSAGKQKKQIFQGPVTPGQTAVAVNRSFTPETKARIRNTSLNASVFAFLAPVGDAQVNGNGREIKAGKSRNFTMADLGDVNDTFLLVHNLSNVNGAGYVIEI